MKNYTNFSLFDLPYKRLDKFASKHNVHCYACYTNGQIIMVNEQHQAFFQEKGIGDPVGRNIHELLTCKKERKAIFINNNLIQNCYEPKQFHEVAYNENFFSFKSQLKNNLNQTIGIGGISCCLHQLSLKEMLMIMNELYFLSHTINKLRYSYVANYKTFDLLSADEKKCVSFLLRSMTNKEMAENMGVTSHVIGQQLASIKNKLGCSTKSQIIDLAFEHRFY